MKKVKLQSSQAFKAGQTNNIPYAGDVTFDEQATIEVDETLVDEIIAVMPEFSIVSEDGVEPEEVKKAIEEEIKPQVEEGNDLGKGDEESKIAPQTEENDILGSATGEVAASEEEVPAEQEDEVAQVNVEEIAAKLEEKSATDLKAMVAQISEDKAKELKNKKQYIEFLVEELSK